MSFVVRDATIKLGALGGCERCGGGNAVPELLHKHQALIDAELFDAK